MLPKTLSFKLPLSLAAPRPALLLIGLSLLSFFIPFFLAGPQSVVGTIVNASLFLAVIFLPKKLILPLIVLPSLGVLGRGVIFGPLTMFLVYFLPFIWLGNLALILVFKKLYLRFHFLLAASLAASAKFLFLFIIAHVYFELSLAPQIFLQMMGLNQFLTALAGGLMAWFIFNFYDKQHSGHKRTA